jgi:SAM-dependent methyltransferase
LLPLSRFGELCRVTSDCRPFRAGGELYVCQTCAAVQKRASPQWLSDIAEIYTAYEPYFQAGGEEQRVFDHLTGALRPRSDVIVERLLNLGLLPQVGAALDIGCGTGVTLRSLSRALPRFQLFGQDIGRKLEASLASIPRFRKLYTVPLDKVDGAFDLITLIHSLEHFPQPLAATRGLPRILAARGTVVVQVSDTQNNPFDLLIADHLMHFSPDSLRNVLAAGGLGTIRVARDWVSKELTGIACADPIPEAYTGTLADPKVVYRVLQRQIAWLGSLAHAAQRERGENSRFGLFGTSIAATWLAATLDMDLDFFVDEDVNRVDRPYLGKPVFLPSTVEAGSTVFLALTPVVADAIRKRLGNLPLKFVSPPTMEATAL